MKKVLIVATALLVSWPSAWSEEPRLENLARPPRGEAVSMPGRHFQAIERAWVAVVEKYPDVGLITRYVITLAQVDNRTTVYFQRVASPGSRPPTILVNMVNGEVVEVFQEQLLH